MSSNGRFIGKYITAVIDKDLCKIITVFSLGLINQLLIALTPKVTKSISDGFPVESFAVTGGELLPELLRAARPITLRDVLEKIINKELLYINNSYLPFDPEPFQP